MSDGMIVSAAAIYFGTAAVLALGSLAIAGLGLRQTGTVRRLFLVGSVPAAAMAGAYVFMGMEWVTVTTAGREQSIARFVGYTLVLLAFTYVVRELLGFSRRKYLVVSLILVLTPWFALASWIATGVGESLFNGLSVLSYLVGAYVLFGPLTRWAGSVSGERRLLYVKLRNLFVLCWGALILQSAISEQSLGLTNLFVGQLSASYTDLIFMFGIGLLVISGKALFEDPGEVAGDTVDTRPSGSTGVTAED